MYVLHKKYSRFTALVGADKSYPGTVGFTVVCDGREVKKNGVMKLKVYLHGMIEIKLIDNDGGTGLGNDDSINDARNIDRHTGRVELQLDPLRMLMSLFGNPTGAEGPSACLHGKKQIAGVGFNEAHT